MTDNPAQLAHELAETAATKARELADQARHAVDDTVSDAKEVVRDLEESADTAVLTARVFALDVFDKVAAAYKRNPALVIGVGSAALATVALLTGRGGKRR